MAAKPEAGWQDIGWNGLQLQVPADWQPVVILNNYLLFEHRYAPTLELKWLQNGTSLSPERLLKQLRKSNPKKITVRNWLLPAPWKEALAADFTGWGFRWQEGEQEGKGLLLNCSRCNRTTLLQFHGRDRESLRLRMLNSLIDHPTGTEQQWSIYDIAFSLPVSAGLKSQEFLTGSYRISFHLPKDQLTLHLLRMKPAEVLLAGNDLQAFGRRFLKGEERLLPGNDGPKRCCWQKQGTGWQRMRAKLRRGQADHLLCLHHVLEKNVILGVQAESNRPIDRQMVREVLAHYSAR